MADMEKNETIDTTDTLKNTSQDLKEKRLFTQEEVNHIVRERLARERQKSRPEERTEKTALSEIEETVEDASKSENELPQIMQSSDGLVVLDAAEDIAKYREIFGPDRDGDILAMRDFLNWKKYAEAHGTEIEPIDARELSIWMDEAMREQGYFGHEFNNGEVHTLSETRKDAPGVITPDMIMRKIFGLPQKKGR